MKLVIDRDDDGVLYLLDADMPHCNLVLDADYPLSKPITANDEPREVDLCDKGTVERLENAIKAKCKKCNPYNNPIICTKDCPLKEHRT